MKSAYWAWGAVVADLGVFMGPLPHSTSTTAFVQVWVLHAGACAILATSSLLLMPAANRRGLLWTWLLLFCFAMIAPVLGALSILIITHTTLRRALENHNHAKPKSVARAGFYSVALNKPSAIQRAYALFVDAASGAQPGG